MAVHRIADNYLQPYTMAYCIRDRVEGPTDYRPIAFPIVPGVADLPPTDSLAYPNASIDGVPALEYPAIVRAQLLAELSGSGIDHVVKWVELPHKLFPASTIGVIILLPRPTTELPGKDTTSEMIVCNIGAGWGSSSLNITTNRAKTSAVSSAPHVDPEYFAHGLSYMRGRYGPEEASTFLGRYQAQRDTITYAIPFYPPKPVQVSQEWAEYLNPYVPVLKTTVIDVLMKNLLPNRTKTSHPEILAQNILTGLMTNGMARTAFTSRLQGNVTLIKGTENATKELDANVWLSGKKDFFKVDPDKSKDWLKLRVDSTIEGYAYNTRAPGPKAAIAFLLAYCVLALAHLFYSAISGTP